MTSIFHQWLTLNYQFVFKIWYKDCETQIHRVTFKSSLFGRSKGNPSFTFHILLRARAASTSYFYSIGKMLFLTGGKSEKKIKSRLFRCAVVW